MKFEDSGIFRDREGLNEKAFHFLEVAYLHSEMDFGNAAFEVRGARLLSQVPQIDPAVITAHLASGTMIPVAHDKVAETFSPRVADIITRMGEIVRMQPAQHRAAIAASDEGVRLSYLVKGIDKLEDSLARYAGKPLGEAVIMTALHKGSVVKVPTTVGEVLKDAYENATHLTQHIVVETGAQMLGDRLAAAMGQVRIRLASEGPAPSVTSRQSGYGLN